MEAADKKLLLKFLNNTCTLEENRKVQQLLQQPEAQEVMEELTRDEWNNPVQPDEKLKPVLNAWRGKVNARIAEKGNRSLGELQQTKRWSFLRYAAIWAGLILVGSVMVWQVSKTTFNDQVQYVQKLNTHGQPEKYTLPDGSEVFLGAGSRVSYRQEFSGSTREVELSGEAFFDVQKNPDKPFMIHTGDIETKVFGTSFKVEAFEGQPVVVSVATGKVGVSHHSDNKVKELALLTRGLKVTWDNKTQQAIQSEVDVYGLDRWTTGDMVFDKKTMKQIADELQRRYAVTIEFVDREITRNEVSGMFPKEKPVIEVMQALAVAGEFRYETSDNKIYRIYKIE